MVSRKAKKRQYNYTDTKETLKDRDNRGFSPTAFRLPEGVELFRFEDATKYKLDVIGYRVGKNNPQAEEGKIHWKLEYQVHPRIGVGENGFGNTYCCPRKCFSSKKKAEKCPLCDIRAKLMRSPDDNEEQLEQLKTSKRILLVVRNRADKEKGWQILDTAYFGKGAGFGEMLDDLLDALDDGDKRLKFWRPKGGSTLVVKTKKAKFNGRTFYRPSHMELIPRKEDYDEEVIDEIPCLDELLIEPDYDALKTAYLEAQQESGSDDTDDDDDEEKKPKKGKKSKKDDEDEEEYDEDEEEDEGTDDDEESDDDDDEDEEEKNEAEEAGIEVGTKVKHKKFGECEVTHVSKDGTSLRLKDEDDEVHKGIAPSECKVLEDEDDDDDTEEEEDEDEDEEDEAPKKKGKGKKVKDDEDDEDKKPAKKGKKSKKDDDENDSEDDDEDIPFDDEDDSEDDDEEEDDEEKPKKGKKAPAKKGKKSKK